MREFQLKRKKLRPPNVERKMWYDHKVEKVLESEEVKILWDFKVQTDKVLEQSRPDIVVLNKTLKRLKVHLQPTVIAYRGTISIYENPAKAEIHPIRSLR